MPNIADTTAHTNFDFNILNLALYTLEVLYNYKVHNIAHDPFKGVGTNHVTSLSQCCQCALLLFAAGT